MSMNPAIKLLFAPPDVDIFESGSEALVNPVNCVGVAGKGLAAEFKKRFPLNFRDYLDICRVGGLGPGECHIGRVEKGKQIINLATKQHWQDPSQLKWVERGVANLCQFAQVWDFKTIALPALGCGCGGLDWPIVKRLIVATVAKHNKKYKSPESVTLIVYSPKLKAE